MKNSISTGKVGPYQWAVYCDEDATNPLEWEDITIFPYWHRNYILGKDDGGGVYGEPEEFLKVAKKQRYEFLPVYAYIHGGATVRVGKQPTFKGQKNTSPFSCRWDSGQVGFIAIAPKDGRREWGRNWRKDARAYMEGVVKEFAAYLEGECYRYEITRKGEHIDGCCGYIGDLSYVEREAEAAAERLYHAHQSGKEFERRFMCC